MANWKLFVIRLLRQIWFRITLYCLGGVLTAFVAMGLQPYIPEDVAISVGADSVGNILGIMAASMLTVTTFSLTTMVSAFGSARSNVTPRATQLIMEDTTAQNALAAFLGAFLFSIVGIVALSTGAYGSNGRLVLLAVTILVIFVVVLTLLRWIARLPKLGTVSETIRQIEEATSTSLTGWCRHPHLRAAPRVERSRMGRPVYPERIGYIQNIDAALLARVVEKQDAFIDVDVLPGAFVEPARPVAFVAEATPDESIARIRDAFLIGDRRTYEQDPRFGLIALGEVASRALSPGINDPGTAIAVLGAGVRILAICREERCADDPIAFPKVRIPGLSVDDMFDDFFSPIARDGAGRVEVGIRLQKALRSLSCIAPDLFFQVALAHSASALRRALRSLDDEEDRERLRSVALVTSAGAGVTRETARAGA